MGVPNSAKITEASGPPDRCPLWAVPYFILINFFHMFVFLTPPPFPGVPWAAPYGLPPMGGPLRAAPHGLLQILMFVGHLRQKLAGTSNRSL